MVICENSCTKYNSGEHLCYALRAPLERSNPVPLGNPLNMP